MPKGLREGETQMNFRITENMKDAFIAKAKENKTSASTLIVEFIRAYLDDRVVIGEGKDVEQLRKELKQEIDELKEFKQRIEPLLGELAA